MNDQLRTYLGNHASYFHEDDVVEISLNPDGCLFVERFGSTPEMVGNIDAQTAIRFLRFVAVSSDDTIERDNPTLSATVPGTPHRIEMLCPPVVRNPSFSVRRHRDISFPLENFFEDKDAYQMFLTAIERRDNILIAGETGAGKTSFAKAMLHEIGRKDPDTRVLVLEDTDELKPTISNAVCLLARRGVRSMDDLLHSTLRLAPDRIVVGEVRSGSTMMTLFKAWSTGHRGGLATIHADSASDVIIRLEGLVSEVSLGDQSRLMASAIDLSVFIEKRRTGGKITSMSRFSVTNRKLHEEKLL